MGGEILALGLVGLAFIFVVGVALVQRSQLRHVLRLRRVDNFQRHVAAENALKGLAYSTNGEIEFLVSELGEVRLQLSDARSMVMAQALELQRLRGAGFNRGDGLFPSGHPSGKSIAELIAQGERDADERDKKGGAPIDEI
jgi:hypothetical protein